MAKQRYAKHMAQLEQEQAPPFQASQSIMQPSRSAYNAGPAVKLGADAMKGYVHPTNPSPANASQPGQTPPAPKSPLSFLTADLPPRSQNEPYRFIPPQVGLSDTPTNRAHQQAMNAMSPVLQGRQFARTLSEREGQPTQFAGPNGAPLSTPYGANAGLDQVLAHRGMRLQAGGNSIGPDISGGRLSAAMTPKTPEQIRADRVAAFGGPQTESQNAVRYREDQLALDREAEEYNLDQMGLDLTEIQALGTDDLRRLAAGATNRIARRALMRAARKRELDGRSAAAAESARNRGANRDARVAEMKDARNARAMMAHGIAQPMNFEQMLMMRDPRAYAMLAAQNMRSGNRLAEARLGADARREVAGMAARSAAEVARLNADSRRDSARTAADAMLRGKEYDITSAGALTAERSATERALERMRGDVKREEISASKDRTSAESDAAMLGAMIQGGAAGMSPQQMGRIRQMLPTGGGVQANPGGQGLFPGETNIPQGMDSVQYADQLLQSWDGESNARDYLISQGMRPEEADEAIRGISSRTGGMGAQISQGIWNLSDDFWSPLRYGGPGLYRWAREQFDPEGVRQDNARRARGLKMMQSIRGY